MIYTKDWIASKAASPNGLSVSKYSWSHEKLRKKTRRMCKDGILTMERQDKQNFYYKLAEVQQ